MRAVVSTCVALLLSTLLACGCAGGQVEETPPPETTTLVDLSGAELDLDALAGHEVLLLAFWTADCRTCPEALRFAENLHRAYADFGLHVLAVHLDGDAPLAQIRQAVERHRLTMRTVVDDGTVAEAWNPDRVSPSLVLLDRDGEVAWLSEGFDMARAGTLEVEVRRLVEPTAR